MKKLFYLLLIIGLAVIGCSKSESPPAEVEVSFLASMGGNNLKSTSANPTFDCSTLAATYAVLVINGHSYKANLIREGDQVYTKSIKLPRLNDGEQYNLTSFILYAPDSNNDGNDEPILATPMTGSPYGVFVDGGLPKVFYVSQYNKNNVSIQILCYSPTQNEEFGFSFSFEHVYIRELCMFGDICVDTSDYEGSIYENQKNKLQHDLPAIFRLDVYNNNVLVASKHNEQNLGEGEALCIQFPDYEAKIDNFRVELWVLLNYDINDFGYDSIASWTFSDNSAFPVPDISGDGVIDFVIGDCVPNADLIFPYDKLPYVDPVDDVLHGSETAFAKSSETGISHCFLDDNELNNNRWGWTNGEYTANNVVNTLTLFAGAAHCDGGTNVGQVKVKYLSTGNVEVEYIINSGVSLDAVHLYVGKDRYPMKHGKPTVSPGQFTYNDDDKSNGIQKQFTITGQSGPIFVIAHADVSSGK